MLFKINPRPHLVVFADASVRNAAPRHAAARPLYLYLKLYLTLNLLKLAIETVALF